MTITPTTSRRALLLGSAALLALAGCGSNDGSKGGDKNKASDGGGTGAKGDKEASGLLPAAEGKTTYPLTLKNAWGETTLEKRPERIAVLTSAHDAEYLAMLGVNPVLVPDDMLKDEWMKDRFSTPAEHVLKIERGEPLPFEKIAAAKPDLIVKMRGVEKADVEKLSAIAPVVAPLNEAAPKGTKGTTESWQERLTRLGEALDLSDAAKKAISDHEAACKKVVDANPDLKGKTISYCVYYGGQYGLYLNNTTNSNSAAFFEGLGFAPHPHGGDLGEGKVSNELLPLLDADVMLMSDNSVRSGDPSTLNEVTDLDLFKKIPVVKDGRMVTMLYKVETYEIDGKDYPGNPAWALHVGGPVATLWAMEQLAPFLTAAVKK